MSNRRSDNGHHRADFPIAIIGAGFAGIGMAIQLKKAGINVEMQIVEHATYHENIRKNLNPFVLYGGTRITDADPWLSLFFDSKEIPDPATGNKGTNFAHYKNIDDLLVAGGIDGTGGGGAGGGGGAAAPETDDRDFAVPPRVVSHRNLRVVSATNAHRMPRIQKRTTT